MSDEQDYKDYLDYIEYQKHVSGQPSQANSHNGLIQKDASGDIDPLPKDPWMRQAALTAGTGGIQKAAGEGLGALISGAGKLATKGGSALLQKAVGLKRYVPGLGETLADEGVIGTKGMMRAQVEQGLANRGQEIGDLAKSMQEVSTKPVAEQLGEKAARLVGPDGQVLPDNIQAYHKYIDAATQASQEGSISGEVAATRRAQYGKIARSAGRYKDSPSQGLKSQLAGDQQAGYSQALKGGANTPPGLAEADKAYGALSQASAAMARPESLTSMGLVGKAIPAAVGGAVGGIPGAAVGAALETPLAQSALGRGLIGAGRGLSSKPVNSVMRYAPATLQELLSPKIKDEDRE